MRVPFIRLRAWENAILFLLVCAVLGPRWSSAEAKMVLPHLSAAAGTEVAVPITAQELAPATIGIDLRLQYEPEKLIFKRVEAGALIGAWRTTAGGLFAHDQPLGDGTSGRLVAIAAYGAAPIQGVSGEMVKVYFTVAQNAPSTQTKLRLLQSDANETAIPANEGSLELLPRPLPPENLKGK